MKKLSLLLLAFGAVFTASAQKLVPKIKSNSVINYTLTQNGQDLPLVLTITSLGDPVKMDWSIDGYGSGSYQLSAKALQSGKGVKPDMPDLDVLTKLPDYQTVACVSKDVYNDMVTKQLFEYNDVKYKVSADNSPIKINDKELDVTHAVAVDGKGELWILNNPAFPLICKSKDTPYALDLNLVNIQ